MPALGVEIARPRQIMLYVLPEFTLTELAAVLDIFRCANTVTNRELYTWTIMSTTDGNVRSTAGVGVEACDFSKVSKPPDLMVFLGGEACRSQASPLKTAVHWLRCRRTEVILLSDAVASIVSTGIFGAEAVSAHWQELSALNMELVDTPIEDTLFSETGRLLTSSGYVATFDVFLHILRRHHGSSLATLVADILVKGEIRQQQTKQRQALRDRLGIDDLRVLEAVEIMEQYEGHDFKIGDVTQEVNICSRQLERLFRKYFDESPMRYYSRIKLEKAKTLIEQTGLPISEISLACGFSSLSNFNRSFRSRFRETPTQIRTKKLAERKTSEGVFEKRTDSELYECAGGFTSLNPSA
ncbi:helix-turn-helix domain-containing protein [Ruegeria sp. 2012CJ41-6]|uniref:Helix-turn-helix domain-containing protein n=1 Tax=Ruegeria spongiae TaxID=2942209 RepID=A0ABT0Q893_9RHOB|nr:helix-turn-helix domain-containing protein [Ruegeria spongiae]MCL6286101.1 helix-turn-helix domain-containing protein [Ruegeria spongiae]